MKALLFFAFIVIIVCAANATTYYIAANGNDANNGTSASTPWKTLTKLNSFFSSLKPGDYVLLNRGDVFYGSITVNKSGTSGSPITIGAYGSGASPVITGFTSVTAWTNLGSNIWESTSSVSTLSTVSEVSVNGVNTAMGRYPNTGYLTYQNYSGNTSITSSSINSSATNWTGAEVVIKKTRWIINRNTITAHSGGTLTYSNGGAYTGTNNFGFFIQNDSKTLDQQNEWYFNPSTKKIRIYSSGIPTGVQVPGIDNLVYSVFKNYITFSDLSFSGGNNSAFYIGSCANMLIQNCSIDFCYNGILGTNFGGSSANFKLQNSTINYSNNNAVILTNEFSNALISNNTISNTGLIAGMGGSNDGTYQAINVTGTNTVIQYNEIYNSGYIGIGFNGNSIQINNNFINGFCIIKDDGGGIYTGNIAIGNTVSNNIVINGIGNGEGTTSPTASRAHGIFVDEDGSGVQIVNNSIGNIGYAGIFLHNIQNIGVLNNTIYNAEINLLAKNDNAGLLRSLTIKNNILFGKDKTQLPFKLITAHNDILSVGIIDSNYYARPIDDNLVILTQPNGEGTTEIYYNLANWQSYSGFDGHSKKSPKTITTTNDLNFVYNETASNKTIPLNANYINVNNASFNGSITLSPYTSAVLIKNGATTNQSPIANAGTDQTITLPISSANLSGSGTDPDGTIASYLWSKVSGPASGVITSPASAATTITGLVQGLYQYQLQVTDNGGATNTDIVQITVNAAGNNIAPTANAGGNGSIILPINSVSLSGIGNDPDGSITAYNWTKSSGPAAGIITSPNSAATSITGMVQGVYVFQLMVTDNNGATATSTVQITVYAAANNIAPTANAGNNASITLPTNSVNLSGSGNDPDGSITAYNWTKSSGPAASTITSPNSAATSITGMVQGVYIFQLMVTDNKGSTATSTVQITVNAAASNIAPTANAGNNASITLPTNSVNLSGSGNDPDGSITAYNWTKSSGPAAGTITSPNSAATSITGMVQGVYIFQLMVTDNGGATATSTVQITVNAAGNNIAPTANAGGNGSIILPINSVSLSGIWNDPDGSITAYNWTKSSGPAAGIITSPNSAATSITGMVQGVYVFQLMVTDNNGATATSTVQITVYAAANNIAPTANAGNNASITLPTNSVNLSGSGNDPDGSITAYNWTKSSGPAASTITSPNSAATSITGMVQGVYIFQLMVTDNKGSTATSTVQITVNAAASNIAPTANAGNNASITLPTNSVNLSGSGNDPDGSITAYNWTKSSGPAAGTITSPNSAATSITGMVQGVYIFQLMVTDNGGATATSTVQITVNAAGNNIAPTANAGGNGSIILPINSVSLSGIGNDPDGSITAYNWTKSSGPAAGIITSPNSAATSITGMVQGVYVFQLMVTDNNGATATSTVQITVYAAANNIAPTANAGNNASITLPTNSVNLSGSGNDPDGSITAYNWTKSSGPAAGTITSPNSAATSITGMVQGVYIFQLMVTDNKGSTATSTVQITVNAAASNIAPTANAGGNGSIILPINSVSLSGAGNDPDGSITAYNWTKSSGPAAGTITSPNSAATSITGMVQGVYIFQLMVTDNGGATATSTVQITVFAAGTTTRRITAGSEETMGSLIQPGIKVFPNPFVNSITINIAGEAGDYKLTLVDISGRIVWAKSGSKSAGIFQQSVNTSLLENGVYFLKIIQNDTISVIELVK